MINYRVREAAFGNYIIEMEVVNETGWLWWRKRHAEWIGCDADGGQAGTGIYPTPRPVQQYKGLMEVFAQMVRFRHGYTSYVVPKEEFGFKASPMDANAVMRKPEGFVATLESCERLDSAFAQAATRQMILEEDKRMSEILPKVDDSKTQVKGVGKIYINALREQAEDICRDKKRTLHLARWQAAGAWFCFVLATMLTVWMAMTGVTFLLLATAGYGFYLAIHLHRRMEETKARLSGGGRA